MIQDIHPDQLDNHYIHLKPETSSRVIVLREGKLLVLYDAKRMEFVFPLWEEFDPSCCAVYLFAVNEARYFLLLDAGQIPGGYEWLTLQEMRRKPCHSNTGALIAFTAWHLAKWYESSRFCGRCGTPTGFDTVERAMTCPKCGNKIYPRINPAVIVGVKNGERLLLTKYKVGYGHNAMIAGFTEIGETMEQTVEREVMEEVGLKVKNIRYYKSQPWGIAADILLGYYCEVDGDDTIHRDDSELKYAEWVERQDIELQPDSLSLTNEMMQRFKEGLE